jgi:23S rRNA pseudouridine1911/1915/1917 synthase
MNSSLEFNIKEDEVGLKLREYLRSRAKLSGRLIKGAAMDERIFVNGKCARLNYVLKCSDTITFEVVKEESQNIEPEDIDIEVIYEDTDVIVVNKSPGMVVHPTKSYPSGTLANGLINYFRNKGEKCIVRLVSRLDMDTSGLILVAKNQYSHMALARDMQNENFKKTYIAIVHGNIGKRSGTINLPIYRTEGPDIRRIVDKRGQESITHYEVVESFKEGDVVKVSLETGRTHQIRVHMTNVGHPLFGDSLYGKDEPDYIKRQALHAYKLSFPHPRTGDIVSLESKLPEDMENLIKKLKNDSD